MAIMAMMLRRRMDLRQKELDALNAKEAEFAQREEQMTKDIEGLEADKLDEAEETVKAFEEERAANRAEMEKAKADIDALRGQIGELEKEDEKGAEAKAEEPEERSEEPMKNFDRMTPEQRTAFVQREDVKNYLNEVRSAIREKRAITNVGLTIPEVMLGLLKENIEGYSKLYSKVTVRRIGGTGRMLIMGALPEAIWTDCCANLNELSLTFNDIEVDCYKVGGYFAVCNANLEDSDVNLAGEILTALGQSIGLALDKAILYGRNANTTQKMPQGIVSRLAQTEAPTGYPATARAWADLHTTNMITVTAANSTGVKLVQALVGASGAAKGKYSRGGLTWMMNEATYTKIMTELVSITASGSVVTGIGQVMPVVGGEIVILPFMADNQIVAGYYDEYVLVERAGNQFASSEHARFLADQTVFKGTARYDGVPAIAEGFVAIGIGGTAPSATMTFPSDTANT